MSAPPQLTAGRKIERKELITLFSGLPPGGEVDFAEIAVLVGLDHEKTGDRNLIYAVREHCRDVLGIVIEAVAGRGYRRVTDADVAGKVVERRRDRIYRQSVRGAAESVAIHDFAGLDRNSQLRLLAHQSVFGAIALASHEATTKRVVAQIGERLVQRSSPDDVMLAVAAMKQ